MQICQDRKTQIECTCLSKEEYVYYTKYYYFIFPPSYLTSYMTHQHLPLERIKNQITFIHKLFSLTLLLCVCVVFFFGGGGVDGLLPLILLLYCFSNMVLFMQKTAHSY